jgi:hypothetical protein
MLIKTRSQPLGGLYTFAALLAKGRSTPSVSHTSQGSSGQSGFSAALDHVTTPALSNPITYVAPGLSAGLALLRAIADQ